MENTTKRYWKGLEELRNDAEFVKNAHREFGDAPTNDLTDNGGTYRRDFLKMLGFGVAAVSLAACEAPVKKAIPYLNKPEEIEPTIANWYASTYTEGGDYTSILVKTREGRPIKIEGNKLSSVSGGGVGVRANASLLSLYDNEKLRGPQARGKDITWEELDKQVVEELGAIAAKGGNIRLVSGTIMSPTTKKIIADFKSKYPTTQHIQYDASSASGLLQANGGVVPSYDFSKAHIIVGLSCDFLGTWLSPTEFSRQYVQTRKLNKEKQNMSQHFQFESIMSLTGANADYRTAIKPSQEGLVALALYNKITGNGSNAGLPEEISKSLDKAALALLAHKGMGLVVSGSNDSAVQVIVNAINSALGSYGITLDMGTPAFYRQGNDGVMNTFADELKLGKVDAVFFYGANPVYNHPRSEDFKIGIEKTALSVSFADRADETASICKYIAPDAHYLESWNDAEPKRGFYSLCQPTISLIFNTRQAQNTLLGWTGAKADFYTYLKSNWKSNILKGTAWEKALHDGVYEISSIKSTTGVFGDVASASTAINANYKANNTGLELVAYEKVGMGTGSQANNPWIQEFPDPISKACWDNYAALSQKTAIDLGVKQDDIVKIDVKGKTIELPVLVQPGQANGTVAVAIGYGREKAGKAADNVGKNIYPLLGTINNCVAYCAMGVSVSKIGETRKIAQTQTHETVMGRTAVVQEATLADYIKNPSTGKHEVLVGTSNGPKKPTELSLWNGHTRPNHSWGMVIDLNSCTGCGSCVISCQSENNIPVVGRKEVIMRREMHWMRIDRYYSSDIDASSLNAVQKALEKGLEKASENPEVIFQPLMCQHCNNAPCETVCPVLATTHSTEGLNQMTYNRCIGTRYCANNCPYKVRRFNWFKYFDEGDLFDFHFNNDLGKMVINPDVTVRSRGVMEKCSMCVQRIQAGKLDAKKEKRTIKDGEIETACSQSCPTNAIVFGDMNDATSSISKLLAEEKEGRSFVMLEEINVQPQVSYLRKIRNKEYTGKKKALAHGEHHG